MTRQDHTFEDVRNLPLRKAIAVVNIWGPQKRERALERKRAADRNARRLERSRTKEHIARLEERIQLLLSAQDSSRSNITEKLLAENAALHERIHEYQKLVNSAKLTLENIQSRPGSSPQSASWARPEQAGEAQQSPSVPTDISPAADSPRPVDQPTVSALLNPIADANLEVHVGEYTNSITSSTAGADLLGHFFRSDYLPGARSVYLLHHPSPLAKTSIYRTSAALPDFHTNRIPPHLDLSAGHTVADVVAEEKLDTFYGTLLPIFSPGLMSLYQGLSDNIPGLNPASVLRDLLPNRTDSTTASLSQLPVPNCIALLKMSVAKYVAGTIREAQSNLEPDQRRSDTEIVAVFWIMTRLLLWMAFPTSKNYSAIPVWYRPTQAQLSVPHPSYIDSLVFPLLREKLVYTYENYKDTTLLKHLNSLYNLKWEPLPWAMCQLDAPIISQSVDDPWEFQLEPNFANVVYDLNSWRMAPDFIRLYPEFGSCVHI